MFTVSRPGGRRREKLILRKHTVSREGGLQSSALNMQNLCLPNIVVYLKSLRRKTKNPKHTTAQQKTGGQPLAEPLEEPAAGFWIL